jgi:hypothetical protein
MKLKKRIKILETQVSELKKQVQSDRVVITDSDNPNLRAEISLKNGELKFEKITTTATKTETSELIFKDNK